MKELTGPDWFVPDELPLEGMWGEDEEAEEEELGGGGVGLELSELKVDGSSE